MKKFDLFTILRAIAITENIILMIIQGGWLTFLGLMFGGVWVWVAYWGWKQERRSKALDYLSRNRLELESVATSLNALAQSGISAAEVIAVYSRCNESTPAPDIGDTTCKNNARSPYIRCAVNPCGPCEGCKDFEPR